MSLELLPTSRPRRSRELYLPAGTTHLHEAREYARAAAAAYGLDAKGREELVYAVNEAVTNAIKHGRPDPRGLIHLSIALEGEEIQVAVRDCGRFAAPAPIQHADEEHGRGFALMATFVDDIRLSIGPGTTIVTLCKAIA